MGKIWLAVIFIMLFSAGVFAQEKGLLIDDFEGVISGGAEGTVDYGSGGGSSLEAAADRDFKKSGTQSIKITFDAVNGGYMWIARGSGLDAKNSAWLVKPENIKWNEYRAISFYMSGSASGTEIAFDIKDNSAELWRFMLTDNFKGWKQVVCPFNDFVCRSDWQPESADKNSELDFPLQSFQWEPRPPAQGALYFDDVELLK